MLPTNQKVSFLSKKFIKIFIMKTSMRNLLLLVLSFISFNLFSQEKDLCIIYSFPYIVDFEAEGNIPGCWEQDATNDHDWIFNDQSGTGAHQGEYFAKFDHDNYGDIGRLLSPELDLSELSSPKLSFWHSQQAYGDDQDELRVYYKTSAAGSWTLIPGAEWTNNIATWTYEEFILPEPSSTYYIAFEGTDDYGYGVRLDYITIGEEVVAQPSEIVFSNITYSAAFMNWDANANETMWEMIVATSIVEDFESQSVIDINAQPQYNFVGLDENTKYHIYLRAKIGDDWHSDWAHSSFKTDCEWFADLPLEEDFEDGWAFWCWRVVDADNDGQTWRAGADHVIPLSGNSVANGAGNHDDYLISPKLNLTGNYELKWYDYSEDHGVINNYDVVISTSNSDLSSFSTILASYECTNDTWTEHTVSLADYNGQTVYIAFHQTYSYSLVWGFGIDDVSIDVVSSDLEQDATDNLISVYPNPASEQITIVASDESLEISKIVIYNSLGQIVFESGNASFNSMTVDVSNFSLGIYTLDYVTNNETYKQKICIQ